MSRQSSGVMASGLAYRSSQLSQNKQKQSDRDTQMAYFKEVLNEAGVQLRYDNKPNLITQEQSLVIRDINKTMRNHMLYPDNSQEFITGLKVLCKKESYFRKALTPTLLHKVNSEQVELDVVDFANVQQESLFRILLNVPCLQTEIVNMLLEHATTRATEDSDDTTWLRLLLTPLRYLSVINDSKLLTTKVLDILDVASYASQLEILNYIPEIVPDNQNEQTSKELSKLLDGNTELTGAIIDCLNSLNLDVHTRNEIQEQVLQKLSSGSSLKIFPILLEFLIIDCKTQNLSTVLTKIRNALDTIMSSESQNQEAVSQKVVIFNRLYSLSSSPKIVAETWINVLSGMRSPSDHKAVDFLILFMLHSSGSSRKRTIEAVFRKRVNTGLFKTSLLENMFKKYLLPQFLKDYLNSIIEIGSSLLKFHNETLLVEFSSVMYKMLFSHELTDRTQRQDILHNLILSTGSSDARSVGPVLNILSSFLEDPKLQEHTLQMMGLLEKLDTLELIDVKQVFDLLCCLTCGENAAESMSGLKDEIHMLVRKQLSSSKKAVKHKGLVAAVVMAKYVVKTSANQSDVNITDDSILSIADLPRGVAQEAAGLLELTSTSTSSCSESIGLYYDQLTSMLMTTPNLDKHFFTWLFETITNDFQNVFVSETVSNPINDIHMSMQYSLNSLDEVEAPIAVNIAELTLKPSLVQANSIATLAPLFRLLRLLHYRQHDGDLATIDALLGCPIIMPVIDDLDLFDTDQIKQITDCVFHCINWFRETISAFVTQKSKKLRSKVIERLNALVELEQLLWRCMEKVPNHKLPTSNFDTSASVKHAFSPTKSEKAVKRPRKKAKTDPVVNNVDETIASTSSNTQSSKTIATSSKKKKISSSFVESIHFREMDTDVILLIKYPLKIDSEVIPSQISQSQTRTIEIKQLKFILKDFVLKLQILTKQKNLTLSHLNVVDPANLITDCARLLPYIDRHMSVVVDSIKKLLAEADGIHDSTTMLTPEAHDLKSTFAYILQCYALIFGWSGFQHSKHLNLLKDCLTALREPQQSQLNSANRMMMAFTSKLLMYIDYCLYLPAAVNLVQIMEALYAINSNPDCKKKIVMVSGKLLTRTWYNVNGLPDTGKNASENIDMLVKAHVNGADVQTLNDLIPTLQNQASNIKAKDDALPMFASINKANFHILYRHLCNALYGAVRTEVASLTNDQHLVLWRDTAHLMLGLSAIAKVQETKTNLVWFLKRSIAILKVFLIHGVPILEIMLRSKTDEVIEILKTMQTSTRFLHHLCCYSKFTKDTSLVAYVPQFRLTLETLLFRVKGALVANNCSAAFWMGTLRNKDLHGEDILSQSTIVSEENEDEEILPTDDSDDDLVSNEDGTASEIF